MHQIAVDMVRVAAAFGRLYLGDEVVDLVHLIHEFHGSFEIDLFLTIEAISGSLWIKEIHFLR